MNKPGTGYGLCGLDVTRERPDCDSEHAGRGGVRAGGGAGGTSPPLSRSAGPAPSALRVRRLEVLRRHRGERVAVRLADRAAVRPPVAPARADPGQPPEPVPRLRTARAASQPSFCEVAYR